MGGGIERRPFEVVVGQESKRLERKKAGLYILGEKSRQGNQVRPDRRVCDCLHHGGDGYGQSTLAETCGRWFTSFF